MSEDLLAGLDPEQRAVAEAVEGPVVVWAGAGTGKTRAVTHRIANAVLSGAHEARHGLAVTFTNRAAGEMRERLRGLGVEGVQARTFHSAALRQLRHFWPRAIGGAPADVLPRTAPLVAEACGRVGVSRDPAVVRDLVSEIAWAKQSQVSAADYPAVAAHREPPTTHAEAAAVYAAYDDLRWERGLIDFDDVLLLTVGILADRPDILDEVRAAYRWFTVDEFQDVSPVQDRLLDLWLGDRDDLCVIGDPAQTIYSFAGATDRFLLDFPRRFPGATQISLVRAYRSTEPIIDIANRVVASGGLRAAPLRSMQGSGPAPVIEAHADEVAEAAATARTLASWHDAGTPWREMAILVRINAQMPVFEEALSDRGIPVVLRGGERFFDRGEVREAITRLRGAARAGEQQESWIDEVRSVLATMGFGPQPPRGSGAVRERWESLASLVSLAETMQAERPGDMTLRTFIDELDRRAESQHAPVADAVTLATVHAAKGLEWDAVCVPGLVEGTFPHAQSRGDDQAVAEERRLFYVAITRARRHLVMSWSRSRTPGGRGQRERSRFLADVAAAGDVITEDDAPRGEHIRGRGRTRGARGRGQGGPARCRSCGKALVTGPERARSRCRTCPMTASEELMDRLREWRLARAHERGVPAYVVFTDATLEALAEARPGDEDALLAISGIGPDKLARYGADLLVLLAEAPESA